MCEEIKDCTHCKHLMPCKAETKSTELTLCDKFVDLFPADDGITSLEELQAINASIPEDVIEPDYSGIEDDAPLSVEVNGVKLTVAP